MPLPKLAAYAALFCACCQPSLAYLTVDVAGPTTFWTPVVYSNGNADPSSDQQTGSSEGDIVGNTSHPAAYIQFGDAGTPSTTDGTLGFRIRVGADQNPSGFKTAMFVGLDANNDGALDLFLGVNNSGASDTIGIWNPGAGLNVSPNTTSIVSTPLATYTITALNYNWSPVNLTIDPTVGTATDINGDGKNDHFLTFSIPLADIVTQLSLRGINGFNEYSTVTYVISTATQANSLNQDLNGVGSGYDINSTYYNLGVRSDPYSINVVPEPNAAFGAAGIALVAIVQHFWRRRNRK